MISLTGNAYKVKGCSFLQSKTIKWQVAWDIRQSRVERKEKEGLCLLICLYYRKAERVRHVKHPVSEPRMPD